MEAASDVIFSLHAAPDWIQAQAPEQTAPTTEAAPRVALTKICIVSKVKWG